LEPLLVTDHFDDTGLRTGENARLKEYNRIPRFVKTHVGIGLSTRIAAACRKSIVC
jgi:hypothetical protein